MGPIETGLLLDGRYRIVARRASGATATVWETQDEFLRRRVAVKILHEHLAADDDFRSRFIDEARTAATVNHPNLVAVYDSITDHPGIVLEWIDGLDLRQRLDLGPVDPVEVVEIGACISEGLSALHAHRLVHRDVKPANILLTRGGQPKLTDFGIATTNAGDRTATGVVLGTAKYLAPEQVRGRVLDGRTDVFALAAVLYEALTGTPPWQRDGDLPTALARLEEDPVDLRARNPDLPPALCHTIMRGLAREADQRWAGAAEFATALRSGSTLAAPPSSVQATTALPTSDRGPDATPTSVDTREPRPPVRPRRPRWPRIVGAAIVGAIAVLGWTLVTSIDDGGPDDPGDDPSAGSGAPISVIAVEAFDPEGTGAPGEHDDRAPFAIDSDPTTAWTTERYESRNLGTKSGVGLVLTLDRIADLEQVVIETRDAQDWAVEVRVATEMPVDRAGAIADYGIVRGGGAGLESTADLAISGRGDTVVVWITDLGVGETPSRLAVSEVTIR